MMGPRRKPGERMGQVEAALIEANQRHGTTVNAAAIRVVYGEQGGDPRERHFHVALNALEKAGRALRVGGRYSNTQWRHVSLDVSVPAEPLAVPRRRRNPGERMRDVELALIDANRQHNSTVNVAAICAVYLGRDGDMRQKDIPIALNSLEQAGRAVRVGGRYGNTQWRHVDADVECTDEPLATAAIEAVSRLGIQWRRAVTTKEVQQALGDAGFCLTVDQARTLLEGLAHSTAFKRTRTASGWGEPKVRRIASATTSGKPRVLWAPMDSTVGRSTFANARDALRYTVATASAEAGKPLAAREIKIWLKRAALRPEGSPEHQAANHLSGATLRTALSSVHAIDESMANATIRVQAFRTPFTCRGMFPQRYSAGEPSERAALACTWEDTVNILRPADELAGVAALREVADDVRSGILARIADTRVHVLAETMYGLLGTRDSEGIAKASGLVLESHRAVVRWEREALGRRSRYHSVIDPFVREAEAVLQIALESPPGRTPPPAMTTIDRTSGTPLECFGAMITEVLLINARSLQYPNILLRAARRVRGPVAGGLSASHIDETRSFLDRVDAVTTLVRACYLPRLAARIEAGSSVLGSVVRDAQAIRGWLEATPLHETDTRMALGIALALLGDIPPREAVWPDERDAEQAVAYVAALAIAVDDDDLRYDLAEKADLNARGSACSITESALARIESGARLAVID